MNINKTNNIGLMRKLVDNYNQNEIEQCIENQINIGCNACLQITDNDETINLLAKAGFMHSLISDGYTINNALRELGKRLRVFS